MATRLEACDDGNFVVHGDLDFHSIADLLEDSDKLFPIKTSSETPSKSPLQISLAEVNRCDSSGVALLIDWLRQAREHGQELKFVNIPVQMQAIIRVTDLEELLPFG